MRSDKVCRLPLRFPLDRLKTATDRLPSVPDCLAWWIAHNGRKRRSKRLLEAAKWEWQTGLKVAANSRQKGKAKIVQKVPKSRAKSAEND